MIRMIRITSALFLCLAACTAPALAYGPAGPAASTPVITVQGVGEIGVAPDEVLVSLDIVRFDPKLDAAKQANDASIERLLALTRRYAIVPEDVRTEQVSMQILREPGERGDDYQLRYSRPLRGYLVGRKMTVRLTDLRRFEAFYAEVLQSADCEVERVTPAVSETRKHRDAARELALRAAREKAVAMSSALGQRIGKAVEITEENNTFGVASPSNSSMGFASPTDDTGLFAPGKIRIRATVTVSFALE
jgi:uncharacterized protein YggE